jgi:hypothetical protein
MTLPGKLPQNLSNMHRAYIFIFNLQQELGQEQMEQRLQFKVKYMKIKFQVPLFCDLFSRQCVGEHSIFLGYETVAIAKQLRTFHKTFPPPSSWSPQSLDTALHPRRLESFVAILAYRKFHFAFKIVDSIVSMPMP